MNGVKQWVLFRGQDKSKPVVLFVHGGPALPLTPFAKAFDQNFLRDFVVVYWDQRGSGKSKMNDIDKTNFSLKLLVDDGLKVTDHILKFLEKQKLILIGHSFGALITREMLKKKPDKFLAHIEAAAFVHYQKAESDRLSFLQEAAKKQNAKQDLEFLRKRRNNTVSDFKDFYKLSDLTFKYKGSWVGMTRQRLQKSFSESPYYSEEDFKYMFTEAGKSFERLYPLLSKYKLNSVDHLKVPSFIVHGKQDKYVSYKQVLDFYSRYKSNKNLNLIFFENSAHFPFFEEPKKFLKVLKQSLKK